MSEVSESGAAPSAPAQASDPKAPEANLAPKDGAPQDPSQKAPEAEAPKLSEKRKYKLKVDGKEEEAEYSDDEIAKELQLSRAARKRLQEAAEYKKSVEMEVRQLVEALKNDPVRVLTDPNIGVDIKKLAEQIIDNEIEESSKTPEQKELERIRKDYEKLKKEREEEMTAKQKAEAELRQAQKVQELDQQISKILEAGDLPASPFLIKRMADVMIMAMDEGIDLNPEQAVQFLKGELERELNDEFIERIKGKDYFSKVAKKKAPKAKEAPPAQSQIKSQGVEAKMDKASPKEQSKIRLSDFLKG